MIKKITGTFIDEITWDIASQNWTDDIWRKDFRAMSRIGIDTAIIIRGGLRHEAVFPSFTVGNRCTKDLAQLFLDLALDNNIKLMFGTYDTGEFFKRKVNPETEFEANKRFIDEVIDRYGSHPALKGWYLCQEPHSDEPGIKEYFYMVGNYLKEVSPDSPILIAPFYPSRDALGDSFLSPDEFKKSWRNILKEADGLIDYVAFQDGTCPISELESYIEAASELCQEAGIELWSNAELFERSASFNFPPVDIRRLLLRLETVSPYVSKIIAFEFSHFMSPNSDYPSAQRLYRRYIEQVLKEGKEALLLA